MTEQEVRSIVKSHRWSFLRRIRNGRVYVYAARKRAGKREEMYIAPEITLAAWTVDQLERKLKLGTSCHEYRTDQTNE